MECLLLLLCLSQEVAWQPGPQPFLKSVRCVLCNVWVGTASIGCSSQYLYRHWLEPAHQRKLFACGSFQDMNVLPMDQMYALLESVFQSMCAIETYECWRRHFNISRQAGGGLLPKRGCDSVRTYDLLSGLLASAASSLQIAEMLKWRILTLSCDTRGHLLCVHLTGVGPSSVGRLVLGAFDISDHKTDTIAEKLRVLMGRSMVDVVSLVTDGGGENLQGDLAGWLYVPHWLWCSGHRLQLVFSRWCADDSDDSIVRAAMVWVEDFADFLQYKEYVTADLNIILNVVQSGINLCSSDFVEAKQRWLSKLNPLAAISHNYRGVIEFLVRVSSMYENKTIRDEAHDLLERFDGDLLLAISLSADLFTYGKPLLNVVESDYADMATVAESARSMQTLGTTVHEVLYGRSLPPVVVDPPQPPGPKQGGKSKAKSKSKLRVKVKAKAKAQALPAPVDWNAASVGPHFDRVLRQLTDEPLDLTYSRRGKGHLIANYRYTLGLPTGAALRALYSTLSASVLLFLSSLSYYFTENVGSGIWADVFGLSDASSARCELSFPILMASFGCTILLEHYADWLSLRDRAKALFAENNAKLWEVWHHIYYDDVNKRDESPLTADLKWLIGFYLATPVQSASVERSFSTARRLREIKAGCSDVTLNNHLLFCSCYSGKDVPVGMLQCSTNKIEINDVVHLAGQTLININLQKKNQTLYGSVGLDVDRTLSNYGAAAVKRGGALSSSSSQPAGDSSASRSKAPNNKFLRLDHQQRLADASARLADPVREVERNSYWSNRAKTFERVTGTYNASLFRHVSGVPAAEMGDDFFKSNGKTAFIHCILGRLSSKVRLDDRVVLLRRVQAWSTTLMVSCQEENKWRGIAARVDALITSTAAQIDSDYGAFVDSMRQSELTDLQDASQAYTDGQLAVGMNKLVHDRTMINNTANDPSSGSEIPTKPVRKQAIYTRTGNRLRSRQ